MTSRVLALLFVLPWLLLGGAFAVVCFFGVKGVGVVAILSVGVIAAHFATRDDKGESWLQSVGAMLLVTAVTGPGFLWARLTRRFFRPRQRSGRE